MSEIVPFNTSTTIRQAMYKRKQPEVLWMPVILYHLRGMQVPGLTSMTNKLQDYLVTLHKTTNSEKHCIVPMVHILEMPQCITSLLQPQQQDWMVSSVYLQVGYYNKPCVTGIVDSVACAMTINDSCICLCRIIDPGGVFRLHLHPQKLRIMNA
jgi:hypothetical protein